MIIAALLIAFQVTAQDPRLERLDPETRALVGTVIDSAHGAGLPSEPLVQRALEGATKGAPGIRIDPSSVRPAPGSAALPVPPNSRALLDTTSSAMDKVATMRFNGSLFWTPGPTRNRFLFLKLQ